MTTYQASQLTLKEVHHLFNFQEQYDGSFSALLSLEPISEVEQQELLNIRKDFRPYLAEGQVSEGQILLIAVAPLLRLAGYYHYPIQIKVEENIAKIEIPDEETTITGRLDLLAINKNRETSENIHFWIIIVETKGSSAAPRVGIPQLLTYAYKSLESQASVWGLATNGVEYQFIYIQQGNPSIYQYMSLLNLLETESAQKLLQVLKAIGQQS